MTSTTARADRHQHHCQDSASLKTKETEISLGLLEAHTKMLNQRVELLETGAMVVDNPYLKSNETELRIQLLEANVKALNHRVDLLEAAVYL